MNLVNTTDELFNQFDNSKYGKLPQYANFRKNAKVILCKKNFGAKGVNWISKGQFYLASLKITPNTPITLLSGKVVGSRFYVTIFSYHPMPYNLGIVGMCQVPYDRIEYVDAKLQSQFESIIKQNI